ncbi:MAG: Rv3235 family protein [Mycobacteriales bacterium]|nr:Rv3235 family protein [Mycobacteriales bacterium]
MSLADQHTAVPTLLHPSASHPSRALPALRLVPAPCWEPPYDDELDPLESTELALPSLRLVVTPDGPPPPVVPRTTPDRAPAGRPADKAVEDDEEDGLEADEREHERRRRTPVEALPPARRFAHAMLQRLVEVDAGVRPLAQLERDLTLEAFEGLTARYAGSARTPGPRPTAAAVRSVHVQARPEGVAEVCGTVLRGARPIAVALRLEGRDGVWRCTDLVGL